MASFIFFLLYLVIYDLESIACTKIIFSRAGVFIPCLVLTIQGVSCVVTFSVRFMMTGSGVREVGEGDCTLHRGSNEPQQLSICGLAP